MIFFILGVLVFVFSIGPEKEIYNDYNKGNIPFPIHLSKGNEKKLVEILY